MKFDEKESKTTGGFARNDYFEYIQRFSNIGGIHNPVLEVGTASSKEPTETVQLQSYIGQFLQKAGISLETDDEGPFEMRLLHFRRTFVEKLFAIHAKVEESKKTGKSMVNTHVTIMTYPVYLNARKLWKCYIPMNMKPLKMTMIKSVESIFQQGIYLLLI